MQVSTLWPIVRRWWLIALILALVAGIVAYGISRYAIRPSYTANVVMEVQLGLMTANSSTDPASAAQFAQTEAQLAMQYPNILESVHSVLLEPDQTKNATDASTAQHSVSCAASALTALFSCSVTTHNPSFSADVANALASVFIHSEEAWAQSRYGQVLQKIAANEKLALKSGSQAQYNALVRLEAGVRQAAAQQATILRVVAPARIPTEQSSPHMTLNAGFAFLLVLVLVLGGAVVADRLDDSIRSAEDLAEVGGLPVLGVVPDIARLQDKKPAAQSLVVVDMPSSSAAEAIRVTRTGIAFARVDDPPQVLLVSSSVQGEGKSMIAANLAVSFAEGGKRVVLVDLDLRRPTVADVFETRDYGLTNLLLEEDSHPQSLLAPTGVRNLRVLPSGPIPPNPGELLSSRRMMHVVEKLRSVADVIILDSPPVLPVADAVIASALADAVVLVVRPSQVRRRALQDALQGLTNVNAKVLGFVMNSVTRPDDSYYRYSYGPYGRREKPRDLAAARGGE